MRIARTWFRHIQLEPTAQVMSRMAGAAAAATFLLSIPARSQAGSVTGSLAVTASISSNCTVNASTMPFGAYDPIVANKTIALNATGAISITCNISTPATVTLNAGLYGAFATGTTRAMKDGAADYLSYELYTSAARTTVWNASNSVGYVGTGSASPLSVYGQILAAQTKPAASYSDSVGITVSF
jgi:spore coat protein U-like protein